MRILGKTSILFAVVLTAATTLYAQQDGCPSIELTGPENSAPRGERITFTAKVEDKVVEGAVFNWTVSAGTIASGQGTPEITVDTADLAGQQTVVATLQLSGNWLPECGTVKSVTAAIDSPPEAAMVDEFSTAANCEEGNARFDSFMIELQNSPADHGLIAIYGTRRAVTRRAELLRNFMRMRNFDAGRVGIVTGPNRSNAVTQFWRVPPGADEPAILPADVSTPEPASVPPTKPYLYAGEYSDGLAECQVPRYDVGEYAGVLKADSSAMGKIIISESSPAAYGRKQREIAAVLKKARLAVGRVTFVYKKVPSGQAREAVELWIIPGKAT